MNLRTHRRLRASKMSQRTTNFDALLAAKYTDLNEEDHDLTEKGGNYDELLRGEVSMVGDKEHSW
jgi:hypothetical protein